MGSSDAEGVTDKGAREEGDVAFGEGVVAVFPMTTIEGVHVLRFAGHDADGETTTDMTLP